MKHDSPVDTGYQDFSNPGGHEDAKRPLSPTGGLLFHHQIRQQVDWPPGPNPDPRHICHLTLTRVIQVAGFRPREGEGTELCELQAMMDEK